MNSEITSLITQLIEVHEGRPWMGSSFDRKLGSLSNDEAFTTPGKQMHSVAQILAHLTFWREEGILKIVSGSGSKTDDDPDNWPSNEALMEMGWGTIKEKYDRSLSKLINLLAEREDDFLDQTYYDNDFKDVYPYRFLVHGMLHHDIYHLGQLGLIIKQITVSSKQ